MVKGGQSQHSAVSPSGTRTEARPKSQNKNSTQRPCRRGHPLQWAGTDDDDSRQVSRVEEAGKLQHQPIPGLDPYIGHSNPVSLVAVR